MPAPPAKARLESRHFTGHPVAVQARLDACLASDPAHIMPGSQGPAVAVVQSALEKISARMDARVPAVRDPAGAFNASTRASVRAYKTLRDIRIPPKPVDDIVGRRTLSLLDTEMLMLEGAPAPPAQRFIDVVVHITGFGGPNSTREGEQQGGVGLRGELVGEAYRAKTNRRLETIVFTGGQRPSPVPLIASRVRTAIKDSGATLGLVCLVGQSAGGKNVVQLAPLLANQAPAIELAYVGLSDAAFFDEDAAAPPNADGSNLLIRAPFFQAREKVNIFQSAGNGTEFSGSLMRRIWSGQMPNKEVHGPVQHFPVFRDLTREGRVSAATAARGAEVAHSAACFFGDNVHMARIRELLAGA